MSEKDSSSLTENEPVIAPPVLRPCPWCSMDGRGQPVVRRALKTACRLFSVECLRCEAGGPVCNTEDQAIAAWNRLPEPLRPSLCVIEAMLAFPSVDEFVRTKEAEVDLLWKHIAQITNQTDPAWAITLAKQFIKEREA